MDGSEGPKTISYPSEILQQPNADAKKDHAQIPFDNELIAMSCFDCACFHLTSEHSSGFNTSTSLFVSWESIPASDTVPCFLQAKSARA